MKIMLCIVLYSLLGSNIKAQETEEEKTINRLHQEAVFVAKMSLKGDVLVYTKVYLGNPVEGQEVDSNLMVIDDISKELLTNGSGKFAFVIIGHSKGNKSAKIKLCKGNEVEGSWINTAVTSDSGEIAICYEKIVPVSMQKILTKFLVKPEDQK